MDEEVGAGAGGGGVLSDQEGDDWKGGMNIAEPEADAVGGWVGCCDRGICDPSSDRGCCRACCGDDEDDRGRRERTSSKRR